MAKLYTNEQLPSTSEEAIRQFDEKYLQVISAAKPSGWASRFVLNVPAPRMTFPIALMSTKFHETQEQSSRFRTMAEETFDLRVSEYDAGYEAKALDLATNVFAYRNWLQYPSRLATGEERHVARELAALLESGTGTTIDTCAWDGLAMFSSSHKANPKNADAGTFSNYQSTNTDPTDLTKLAAEATAMRGVKDENGDKLGVEPTEIWLPTEKFQTVTDKLNQERLANGESNPMKGKLTPVHVPELTDPDDFYLVDTNLIAQGIDPLLMAKYQPTDTLGLRFWNESSDFFKDTGKLKVSLHIWTGSKLVFPHAIRRVAGA